MSTSVAATESASAALPATPDVPSGDLEGGAHDAFSLDGDSVLGTMEDLLELTGLTPEEAAEKPAAKGKPKAEAKADDKAAKPETDEDPDYAAIQAINQRSAARRKARREAEAQRAAAPVQTKPAEAPKPEPKIEAKAEAPKLTAPESEAAKAAKEVLGLIAKLAGDDEEAAKGTGATPDKDDRTGLVSEIKAHLETLTAAAKTAAKEEAAALKTEVDSLKTQLGAIESARIVREHIEAKVEPIVADLPTLMGKRNATDIIHTAVGKFWDKFGKLPDVPELARRIERKLAEANPPEKPEKRTNPRKTVSNSLGSPPAARTGPDTRTKAEVEADLFKSLGVE